ncbi:MAG: hypothetical protein QGF59_17120 [Pirellulaceae bacterium]|nr:hypothetical protein [Pirellulaceae bacterium]
MKLSRKSLGAPVVKTGVNSLVFFCIWLDKSKRDSGLDYPQRSDDLEHTACVLAESLAASIDANSFTTQCAFGAAVETTDALPRIGE